MSSASTHVDPVWEPVKMRIGLEAVYEIVDADRKLTHLQR